MSSKVNEIITARIIEKLEAGVAPWRQTWNSGNAAGFSTLGRHVNHTTGKAYRGVNAFLTAVGGFSSTEWMTFKQCAALGGKVKEGSKGTPIVYLHKGTKKDKETGLEKETTALLYYTVFNLDQIEGIAPKVPAPVVPMNEHQPIESAAKICRETQVRSPVSHGHFGASYGPLTDDIRLPDFQSFETPEAYYATLFHELAHATGHKSRLDRDLTKIAAFGSHDYSKEELVAEMAAAFLCAEAGIDNVTLDNSASYLQGWIKVLKGDSKLLVSAAAQAQKASDYILNRI